MAVGAPRNRLAQHLLDLLRLRRLVEVRQKVADHTASPFEELVMSVSGISSSSLFDFQTQNLQNKRQQFQQEFQQLGQGLQSGNLSAAQADFATLQPSAPQANSTLANRPIGQAFAQISRDLQSRNLSPAQLDYATVQQDFNSHAARPHDHHQGGGGGGDAISQLLAELGQSLQSGNLSSAQQAYGTLQQDFQQFAQRGVLGTSASAPSGSSMFSVNG